MSARSEVQAASSAPLRALCVGGLDPSGGAGVLLDAIVFGRLGIAPTTVVTTVTAQNSREFLRAWPVSSDSVVRQLDAVTSDGHLACVKIGAAGSARVATVLADWLRGHRPAVVVLDPATTSSSGGPLLRGDGSALEGLLRLASVITPNAEEAAATTGLTVVDVASARDAAECLAERFGCAVLVTGLRARKGCATDVLFADGQTSEHPHPLVTGVGDVRGTGCMLASALCAHLASGLRLTDAVSAAHATVRGLLRFARPLGQGRWQVDLGALLVT